MVEPDWPQVDLEQDLVCLNPGETRNNDARTNQMESVAKQVVFKKWERMKKNATQCP